MFSEKIRWALVVLMLVGMIIPFSGDLKPFNLEEIKQGFEQDRALLKARQEQFYCSINNCSIDGEYFHQD